MKDLQRILGEDALQRLATFCAGQEFYISGNPRSKTRARIEAIVGPGPASALFKECSGEVIRVPMVRSVMRARLKAQVMALSSSAVSKRQIARMLGIDAKTVRNMLAEQD